MDDKIRLVIEPVTLKRVKGSLAAGIDAGIADNPSLILEHIADAV